jgi:Tol biopolymer transport system component
LSVYDAQAGMFRKYLNGISAGSTDFSRDGQWVAYVTHPQGNLWRSRLDGSERRQLTFPPMGPVLVPRWSPDGRYLAFMEWGAQRKIYLVSAHGGAAMLLLSGDLQPSDPSWSPDGKYLAYAGQALVMSTNPKEGRSEIRILDLSTKQSKALPGSQGMFSPRWSPDGQ